MYFFVWLNFTNSLFCAVVQASVNVKIVDTSVPYWKIFKGVSSLLTILDSCKYSYTLNMHVVFFKIKGVHSYVFAASRNCWCYHHYFFLLTTYVDMAVCCQCVPGVCCDPLPLSWSVSYRPVNGLCRKRHKCVVRWAKALLCTCIRVIHHSSLTDHITPFDWLPNNFLVSST